ncbi:MAG: hypothetical protein J0H40_19375 [Rhizobiales bacterium]|nr:hypothetical protein [Hyphomicrobiales bacterium]
MDAVKVGNDNSKSVPEAPVLPPGWWFERMLFKSPDDGIEKEGFLIKVPEMDPKERTSLLASMFSGAH